MQCLFPAAQSLCRVQAVPRTGDGSWRAIMMVKGVESGHLVQVMSRLCQFPTWISATARTSSFRRCEAQSIPESVWHCCVETQVYCHSTAPSWEPSGCQFVYRTSLRCSFLGMGRKKLEFVVNLNLAGCYYWPIQRTTKIFFYSIWVWHTHKFAAPVDLGALSAEAARGIGCSTTSQREQTPCFKLLALFSTFLNP